MFIAAVLFSAVALSSFASASLQPYVVSIENFRGLHLGGGVLVAEDVVLTSAHNIHGVKDNLIVRAGSSVIGVGGQLITVKNNCPIQNYDFLTRLNDVSVLRLNKKVVLSKNVGVAKLPATGKTFLDAGILSGWGYNVQGGLESVQVKKVDDAACKEIYGDGTVPKSAWCVNYVDNKHSCLDATIGNPLAVDDTVFGVVSAAGACDLKGFPALISQITSDKILADIAACV